MELSFQITKSCFVSDVVIVVWTTNNASTFNTNLSTVYSDVTEL